MNTTHPQDRTYFPPEAVASINRAYADALQAIRKEAGYETLRFQLADHMMFLARCGETDERQLRDLSVSRVLGRPAHCG
jgi:hypothetical protein